MNDLRNALSVSTVALTFVAAAMAGCVLAPEEEGQVSFFVKDLPSDEFTSVFVTFSKVEIHLAAAGDDDENETDAEDEDDENETEEADEGNETEDQDDENETEEDDDEIESLEDDDNETGSSWIAVVNSTQTIDLKQFQGDARAFLGAANVSAGKYTQIRIHVDEAWGIMNGTRVNFTVPSDTLRIVRPWTVEGGEETVLTVDFLLDQSIVMTGQGEYKLKPTLKLLIDHKEKEDEDEEDEDEGRPERPENTRRPEGRGP